MPHSSENPITVSISQDALNGIGQVADSVSCNCNLD